MTSTAGDALFHLFTIGSLRCTALSDGFLPTPARLLAVEVPEDELFAFLRANGQPGEMFANPVSCLHVAFADGRSVIVDAGLGTAPGAAPPSAGRFAEAVAQAGIDPAGIADVLVSHIHPDHVGGLFDGGGRPLFPNAQYHVGRIEADFWQSPETDLGGTLMPPPRRGEVIAIARRFLDLAGDRVRLFEAGEQPVPGVDTVLLAGHTPGQVGFVFDGGDAKLFYTADAAGHPLVSLLHPEWRFAFDADSPLAIATRRALVRQLIDTGWTNFTPHFPWPSYGRVEERDGVPVWIAG